MEKYWWENQTERNNLENSKILEKNKQNEMFKERWPKIKKSLEKDLENFLNGFKNKEIPTPVLREWLFTNYKIDYDEYNQHKKILHIFQRLRSNQMKSYLSAKYKNSNSNDYFIIMNTKKGKYPVFLYTNNIEQIELYCSDLKNYGDSVSKTYGDYKDDLSLLIESEKKK